MRALRYWWPAILWAVVVFFLSTSAFGGEQTARFILPILRWLLPGAEAETLAQIHTAIRKSAHFWNYFVFSLLVLRGVRGEGRGWKGSWCLAALLIAAGYAVLDEFHQSFEVGRGASARDVLLDTAGAAAAQLAAFLRARRTALKPPMNTDEQR